MGEAKRRQAQREPLEIAIKQVGHALRRLMGAASAHQGADCYAHAELGRVLLADLGFTFQTRVGFAAWRVGPGDGDVMAHVPRRDSFLPSGVAGVGFGYHAWLEAGEWLVDFTTYQLDRKCRDLDAMDGGRTTVDWCPDYLLLSRSQVRSHGEVARAPDAEVAYYEAHEGLTARMAGGYLLDADEVVAARILLRNPSMEVVGPCSALDEADDELEPEGPAI